MFYSSTVAVRLRFDDALPFVDVDDGVAVTAAAVGGVGAGDLRLLDALLLLLVFVVSVVDGMVVVVDPFGPFVASLAVAAAAFSFLLAFFDAFFPLIPFIGGVVGVGKMGVGFFFDSFESSATTAADAFTVADPFIPLLNDDDKCDDVATAAVDFSSLSSLSDESSSPSMDGNGKSLESSITAGDDDEASAA
jgi:hypothetical protein